MLQLVMLRSFGAKVSGTSYEEALTETGVVLKIPCGISETHLSP
jgi:hypothetical protein